MPDPQKILATIRRATELTRASNGRVGSVIVLEDVDDVMVVGDLHGNIPAFRQALIEAALSAHPRRHLVFQELVHGHHHYPDDGGDRSHLLVDVVAALKCQFPERVHLILGNHELSELTGRSIAKAGVPLNDLFHQGVQTAYGPLADEVRAAYLEFFAALPLAVRAPNRVFICHTIPDGIHLDDFDMGVLGSAPWPIEAARRGGTVYAITWGRDTSPETADRFASIVDADLFVNGHHPCDEGSRQANHRQLIVDGTDPTPTCCLFPAREPLTIEQLAACARTLTYTL